MSHSAANIHASVRQGLTLVELVIVMVVSGIIFVTIPPLMLYGVKTLVFLPRALMVNQAAGEILDAMTEGSYTQMSLAAPRVWGLRYAIRVAPTNPNHIWTAEDARLGYYDMERRQIRLVLNFGTITQWEHS